jgi:Uma2 family endonuclease
MAAQAQAAVQFMTAAEFEAFALHPDHIERRLELIHGEMYEVVSNTWASKIALRISGELFVYLKLNPLGSLTGADGGYLVGASYFIPDVAYMSYARQPQTPNAAYNPLPPDLAVEVVSPSDSPRMLTTKLAVYLSAGVIVWLVYPDEKLIVVHAPGQPPHTLTEAATLEGGALLPGFEVPVAKIFAGL